MTPLEGLPVQQLVARDFHFEAFRQRVDDGNADPMQAARGLIGFLIEFAARMQRGHDDFERRFLGKFRMRIDRNAAPIVGDGEKPGGLEADIDERGVAGDGLVHGIVEGFREKMMKRRLVGAADIHAWPPADGFEPFEHLDRGGGVAGFIWGTEIARPACRLLRGGSWRFNPGRAGGSLRAALPKRSPFLAMCSSILVIRRLRDCLCHEQGRIGTERKHFPVHG